MMSHLKTFQVLYFLAFAFFMGVSIISCSGDDEGTIEPQRTIKYEITGNFSGKMVIVYTNPVGAAESVEGISLPWSKEINLATANTAAFGAQSYVVGNPGETATAKIYVNGEVKRIQTSTADDLGFLHIPNLSYTFQ
jgi:hypothetical protein